MTASLESTQQSKMDPVTRTWKLTVTDRRLMWLQKKHPGANGHKLQLWAMGAFKEPSSLPLVSVMGSGRDLRPTVSSQERSKKPERWR
jgi:hypothetical protein